MDQIKTWAPLITQVSGVASDTIGGMRAASYNRDAAKAQAEQAIINSQLEARQVQRRNAQVLGKQRAIAAGSGVDPTSGSPMAVYMDSVRQGELDRLTTLQGGKIAEQRGLYAAGLADMQRSAALRKGMTGVGTIFTKNQSLLSDLWDRATGKTSAASSTSSWASSVPMGRYSINFD